MERERGKETEGIEVTEKKISSFLLDWQDSGMSKKIFEVQTNL